MNYSRSIQLTRSFSCSREKLWSKWTTEEGLRSFFSEHCHIDFKVGGAYEMYFMIDNEKGGRGSEGAKIMALEENTFFSFSWNAPPLYPHIRKQSTFVTLHFSEMSPVKTQLELNHYGWGVSESWTQVYNYFLSAWERVLSSLEESL